MVEVTVDVVAVEALLAVEVVLLAAGSVVEATVLTVLVRAAVSNCTSTGKPE